jgi:hypothetical protein
VCSSDLQVKRALTQDDIDGAVAIYGSTTVPTLDVSLNATGSTTVPAGGGSIPYTISVHNTTAGSLTFAAWTEILNALGQSQGLVIYRPSLTLGGGGTISRSLNLNVAGSLPSGSYWYWARVALIYPAPVIDETNFQIYKSAVDAGSPWVSQTASAGWDEENGATPVLPEAYQVCNAYPNPFNPETTLRFDLPENSSVNLTVYDLRGNKVTELLNGSMQAGQYQVKWNAANCPSGIYLYRFSSDFGQSSGKLMLVK